MHRRGARPFSRGRRGDPRFGKAIGGRLDIDAHVKRSAEAFARFLDRFGEQLPMARRTLYERFLAEAPRWLGRCRSRCALTIVQGDAHVRNCFLPRRGGADLRFFDRDAWRINLAAAVSPI